MNWTQIELELNEIGLTVGESTVDEQDYMQEYCLPTNRNPMGMEGCELDDDDDKEIKHLIPKDQWLSEKQICAMEYKEKYSIPFIGTDKQKYWVLCILGKFCDVRKYESIYDDEFFKVNLKTLLASGIIAERNLLEAGLLPLNWIGSKGPHKDQLKKGMKKLTKEQRKGIEKIIDSRKKKTK